MAASVAAAASVAEVYGDALPQTPREVLEALWNKPQHVKAFEWKQFQHLSTLVRPGEHPGLTRVTAPLANSWAWTQTKDAILLVVWVQGPLDDVTVEVTEPANLLVQTEGYLPVVDRALAYAIDAEEDVDTVSWAKLDMVAFKVAKKDRGRRWDRLFDGDPLGLRAVDFPGYSVEAADEEEPAVVTVEVDVPEFVTKRHVRCAITAEAIEVAVEGLAAPFRRYFKYKCVASKSTWVLGCRDDGKKNRVVAVTCHFRDNNSNNNNDDGQLPKKRVVYDRRPDGEVVEVGPEGGDFPVPASAFVAQVPDIDALKRTVFLEAEDGMLTGVVAEIVAHLDGGDRWGPVAALSAVAQNMLAYVPVEERGEYAFDPTDEANDPETIITWWRRQSKADDLEWARQRGIDTDARRRPREEAATPDRPGDSDDDDDDDGLIVEELDPGLPLPPSGMLGPAPVRLDAQRGAVTVAWPRGVSLSSSPSIAALAPETVSNFAWDTAPGVAKIKLYISFASLGEAIALDSVWVECGATRVRIEAVCPRTRARGCFEVELAHPIDVDRSKLLAVKAEKRDVRRKGKPSAAHRRFF